MISRIKMSLWCLRRINYESIDFSRARYYEQQQKPDSEILREDLIKLNNNHSPCNDSSCTSLATKPSEDENSPCESAAEFELRASILMKDKHKLIPRLLATWPHPELRLASLVSPEECFQVFEKMDQLWDFIFQGLFIRASSCQLTTLDLSNFVPSTRSFYNMVHLIPILAAVSSIRPVEPELFLKTISANLGLDSGSEIYKSLSTFLTTILRHRVFQKDRVFPVPKEKNLTIVLDFLHISLDNVTFLCFLSALGLEPVTRVVILPRSLILSDSKSVADVNMAKYPDMFRQINERLTPSFTLLDGLLLLRLSSHLCKHIMGRLNRQLSMNIKSLSLTECAINPSTDEQARSGLISALRHLPNLTRLELTQMNLSNCVPAILASISSPLELLSFASSILQLQDFEAILKWKHLPHLNDLDISDFTSRTDEFSNKEWLRCISGLQACTDMIVFNFSSNWISNEVMDALANALKTMHGLRFVKLDGSPLNDAMVLKVVGKMMQLPKLQKLTLTRQQDPGARKSTSDHCLFWEQVEKLRAGRPLKILIENCGWDTQVDDYDDSVPVFEEDGFTR